MKTDLINYLIKITNEDAIARIWCDLNSWRWPKDLPEKYKPGWWEPIGPVTFRMSQERKQGFAAVVMPFIENKVSKAKIDEWWMAPRDENGFCTPSIERVENKE
jgi:hypothetical protein